MARREYTVRYKKWSLVPAGSDIENNRNEMRVESEECEYPIMAKDDDEAQYKAGEICKHHHLTHQGKSYPCELIWLRPPALDISALKRSLAA